MHRNHGLDLLKTISAFMVICIHVPFPGIVGTIITPLTRIAVPLFFMITGYYYSSTKERNRVNKQFHKVIHLFIGANLLYLLWNLIKACISNGSVTIEISRMFGVKSMLKFILLNESPFGGHLWYLGAILYVLLIILIFEKKWNREKLYPAVPFLLVADLVFGKYSLLLFGRTVPLILVRNFLCVGLPYFLIGDWLHTHNITMRPGKARIYMFVFALTTLVERILLGALSLNAERDHYISTTFLAVFTFLLALQHENIYANKGLSILSTVGAKLSTSIYILHPIAVTVVAKIIAYGSRYFPFISVWYAYLAPFAIFTITAIASWLLLNATKSIRAKKQNHT